ncbi:MAG: DUF2059 domain-containing protein [Hyphomicrobiaceae bacterium]|nr:DUF2059 domain-containing protein [Hyphomicrobiaceae bacterium]
MRQTFKRVFATLVVLFAAFAATGPATAQELTPERLDLARKYVDLTDVTQMYERLLVQVGIRTMRTIVSTNPEITQQVSDTIGKAIDDYKLRRAELMDQLARVYALRFTEEELQQIVDFYETDVGKKLALQSAEAQNELSTVVRVFTGNLDTEFFAKVKSDLHDQGIDI